MNLLIHVILVSGLLAFTNPALASESGSLQQSLGFRNFSAGLGLADGSIYAVTEDKLGFVWLATINGLARYDGNQFTMFKHDPDNPASIPSNEVYSVYVDSHGTLWAGTYLGLVSYNQEDESFSLIQHDGEAIGDAGTSQVMTIYEDRHGILWLGLWAQGEGMAGLIAYDRHRETLTQFTHDSNDVSTIPAGAPLMIQEDRSGTLWVSTFAFDGDSGTAWFDRKNNSFHRFPRCIPASPECTQTGLELDGLPRPRMSGVYENRAGILWFSGFGNGLVSYDRRANALEHHACDPSGPGDGNDQMLGGNIIEDADGRLWYDDRFKGLTSFDPASGVCRHFNHDPVESHSISLGLDDFLVLFQRSNGAVWVTASENIVSSFDPETLEWGYYRLKFVNTNDGFRFQPSGLVEDNDGTLWVSSIPDGLYGIDRTTGVVNTYRHYSNDPSSQRVEDLYGIYRDTRDRLWLGARGGLYNFDRERKSFEFFPTDPNSDKTSAKVKDQTRVEVHSEDEQGHLWFGSDSYVGRFDPDTGETTIYRPDPSDAGGLAGNMFTPVIVADDGMVWAGSTAGLNRLEPNTGQVTHYVHESNNSDSITPGAARGIIQDSSGGLWIGTATGLNHYDTVNEVFTPVKDKYGVPIPGVQRLVQDHDGQLWMDVIDGGLMRLDPVTGDIRRLNENHGFQSGTYRGDLNLLIVSADTGLVIYTTNYGIQMFYPDQIPNTPLDPVVVITDFLLHNEPVPVSREGWQTVLQSSINGNPDITLTHRDYLFAFEFAAPGYKYPQDLRYAYMLEGFDTDWIETGPDRRVATFTSVPPGDYLLRVKAAGLDSGWSNNHTTLRLTILPPWWRTWWAYAFYLAVAFLALFTYVRLRTLNLRQRAALLEKTVEERTARIREHEQQIQHQAEDLEELLHLKEKLIANISHEFRTPLTLILAPAKRLLRRAESGNDSKQLEMIRRNAQRLLRLVDQLLGLVRLGTDGAQVVSSQSVTKTAAVIIDSFHPVAKEKQLQLILDETGELWVHCAPDALEKILLNLLSNAIKYTPEGGRITVTTRQGEDGMVELSVSDTGVGIPDGEQETVFERFHRVGNGGEHIPGAGIGLALVKELVEANEGRVSMVSKLGVGTTVTVYLPIGPRGVIGKQVGEQGARTEAMELEIESLGTPTTMPWPESIPEANGKATILITEDNTDMQSYLVELLSDVYHCLVAGDGEQAIEVAFEHIPDLVLLDVMMPKMDGFQVSHVLKEDERTSHIPILMLTARHDKDSRMESWQEKADGYLTKPFDDDELRLRIANMLEIRDILKQRFSSMFFQEGNQARVFGDSEDGFLKKFEELIERRHAETELDLTEMASSMYMSPRQLQRKLKAVTGYNPSEFLRFYRLRKARELLKSGTHVGVVADAVGFSSPAYFTSCFKAQFAQTPTEYLQQFN